MGVVATSRYLLILLRLKYCCFVLKTSYVCYNSHFISQIAKKTSTTVVPRIFWGKILKFNLFSSKIIKLQFFVTLASSNKGLLILFLCINGKWSLIPILQYQNHKNRRFYSKKKSKEEVVTTPFGRRVTKMAQVDEG